MTRSAPLLDLAAVTAAYLIAVLLRVGARLELSVPQEAVAFSVVVGGAHVLANAALGTYRPSWPERPRALARLALPVAGLAAGVALFNLLSDIHPIPTAAIPPAAAFALAAETALHLRPRWRAIARAVTGRGTPVLQALPLAAAPVLDAILLAPTASIREAIRVIERDVSRIALVVDADRRLLGAITDGDVRRAILAGADLDASASTIMGASPVVASEGASDDELVGVMREHVVRQVPLVDDERRVVDIRLLDHLDVFGTESCPVLIMAGGPGTRLGELTQRTPKPLVRVGGRPVLEMLVRDLAAQGFRRLFLAVSYKAERIEEHFGDGARFGTEITYLREETPLGTAGAIRLAAPRAGLELMVTNADLLTRLNFRELLDSFRRERADLTVAVIESTLQLRYGLIETDGGSRVTAIREKPALRHFVNAGIYVTRPPAMRLVPEGRRMDMDELIRAALQHGLVVGCFAIHEYWTDIGEPADLRRANDELRARERAGRQG